MIMPREVQCRGSLRTWLAVVFLLAVSGAALPAQGSAQAGPMGIPPCAAALCEEANALTVVLDTLWRGAPECGEAAPSVLETLHLAPFTAGSDALRGRASQIGIPSSPAVMRVDHLGLEPFRRYWSEVKVVTPQQVRRGAAGVRNCLFVFAPVAWLGPDSARVVVARSRQQPFHIVQQFVYLERRDNRWFVQKIEAGLQSSGQPPR